MNEIPYPFKCYNFAVIEIVGFHTETINEVVELPANEGSTKFSSQIFDDVGFVVFSFPLLLVKVLDGGAIHEFINGF